LSGASFVPSMNPGLPPSLVRLVNREQLAALAVQFPLRLTEVEQVLYPDWGARG